MIYKYIHAIIVFMFIVANSTFFISAKKILVTGGAGFIGSHVSQQLLQRGDFVVIVDNLNDAYDLSIKRYNLSVVEQYNTHNRLKFYEIDICDREKMEALFENERPDIICHLAARAGVRTSIQDPYEYVRTNSIGTINVFEMARKFGVKHLVCASSSTVYGARNEGSFSENDLVDKQSSPYGATKRAGELLAYVYYYLYGMSITNLRFFSVYGPRCRIDMAPFIFMDALYNDKTINVYGDGSVIRDFTYIDDIVDGIIRSIDTPLGYQIINIGRGEPIVLADFIAIMENIVGRTASINYSAEFSGDVPRTHANITKAQALIGYNPSISVCEGLSKMYAWYKNEYLLISSHKKRNTYCAFNTCDCFV